MSTRVDDDDLPDFDAEQSQPDEAETAEKLLASRIPTDEVVPPDLPATIPPPAVATPEDVGYSSTSASAGSSSIAQTTQAPAGRVAPVVEEGTVEVRWPVPFEQRPMSYQCEVNAHTGFLIEIPQLLHDESDKVQLGTQLAPLLGQIRLRVHGHYEMVERTFTVTRAEVWDALWHEAFAGKHGAEWRVECLASRFAKHTEVQSKLLVDMFWQVVECFRKSVQELKEPWETLKPFTPKKKHHAAWNGLLVATSLPGLSNAPLAVAARQEHREPQQQPSARTKSSAAEPR
eukprot:6458816-Amphidinium_carterae.1